MRKNALEEDMATHSSILAWKILWTGEPSKRQSMGSQESDMTERLGRSTETPQCQRMKASLFIHTVVPDSVIMYLQKLGEVLG